VGNYSLQWSLVQLLRASPEPAARTAADLRPDPRHFRAYR
jgi:hypothetical protein